MVSILLGAIVELVIHKKSLKNIVEKEPLALWFYDGIAKAFDHEHQPVILDGYRLALVEYTDYPAGFMWLGLPAIGNEFKIPDIDGNPGQRYIYDKIGLVAPDDMEFIESLPKEKEAYVFSKENSRLKCKDNIEV